MPLFRPSSRRNRHGVLRAGRPGALQWSHEVYLPVQCSYDPMFPDWLLDALASHWIHEVTAMLVRKMLLIDTWMHEWYATFSPIDPIGIKFQLLVTHSFHHKLNGSQARRVSSLTLLKQELLHWRARNSTNGRSSSSPQLRY